MFFSIPDIYYQYLLCVRQQCELRSNNSFINGMEFTTYSDDMSDNSDNNTFIYHSKRRKLSELFQCDYE